MHSQVNKCLEPGGTLESQFETFEFRPQQLKMAQDIEATLQSEKGIFLAEAGTGTGKSLAYLIPAAQYLSNVIISTGTKNLQEQLIKKDIPLLNKILDQPVRAELVKGRQNYLCMRRFKQFLQQPEFQTVKEKRLFKLLADWAETTNTGDRGEMDFLPDSSQLWRHVCSRRDDCMGGRCQEYGCCFILKLRMRAQSADLVVVNHHLFFADAAMRQVNAISPLPDAQAVIFDEAHLLDDVVTQFLGVHFGYSEIADFIRMVKRWKPSKKDLGGGTWGLTGALGSLEEGTAMFFGSFPTGEGRFDLYPHLNPEFQRRGHLLIDRLQHFSTLLSGEGLIPSEFTNEWKNLCLDMIARIRFFIHHDEPGMAWWGEHMAQGNNLHASPVNIADQFPALIQNPPKPIIMTSATLTTGDSFNYIIDRLGIHQAETSVYPSPFDYKEQGMMYIADHLPDPNHPENLKACASEIIKIVNATEGRAFVLTTSYSAMNQLKELIEDDIDYNLLVQGDAPKHRLIKDFTKDVHSVLLATMSFWQGVDVPGEALSAVIIHKLPFASPADPVTKARIDFLNECGANAFMQFQIPSAVMMLKQGVGRLIRSKSDRGLVAVLDNRIAKKRYGRIFLTSIPEFCRGYSIDDIRAFL